MSQQRSYAVDLQSFLFGDILAVQAQDLWLIVALSVVVAIAVAVLFRGLLYTTFDPVVAQASGIASPAYEYTLLVMLALTIVVSLQAVGIVLVAALLVTPAAAAYQLTSRFSPMMALAAVFGAASTVGGLYLSYYVRASSGATIVLLATLLFFAAIGVKRLVRITLVGREPSRRRAAPSTFRRRPLRGIPPLSRASSASRIAARSFLFGIPAQRIARLLSESVVPGTSASRRNCVGSLTRSSRRAIGSNAWSNASLTASSAERKSAKR